MCRHTRINVCTAHIPLSKQKTFFSLLPFSLKLVALKGDRSKQGRRHPSSKQEDYFFCNELLLLKDRYIVLGTIV